MSIWSDPPAVFSGPYPYAVGERVCGAIDGEPGTVAALDADRGTFTVQWSDVAVVYPVETMMVRKAMPWEPTP